MMFDRRVWMNRLSRPGGALAVGLAASLLVSLLPERWTAAGKGAAASLLAPGQVAVRAAGERIERLIVAAGRCFRTAEQLAGAYRELDQLRRENRRLQAALAALRDDAWKTMAADGDDDQRLLGVECVEARVLGQQARAFLSREHLLDNGSRARIRPNDLVVESTLGLIDRGEDADIEPGQPVLAGLGVWGRIVEVGPFTSTVQTVTEPGYRDLVQLADGNSGSRRPGPQGILEGTGGRLARVRLVEVTEPVAVGDAVYAAGGKGILPRPLLYGHVVRVDRSTGATHWDIWIRPAVDPAGPERVAVLRTVLNPVRVAHQKHQGTVKR